MAATKMMISFALCVFWLFFSLILFTSSSSLSSSSSSHGQQFQVFDVFSSVQQTRQVFSPLTRLSTTCKGQQLRNTSTNSLFLTIHPRSSLPSLRDNNHNNNYSHLTLSRLVRDGPRVHSILTRQSRSFSIYRPEQLESPVISGVRQGSGEYFARIGVGRSAREYYMIMDSGSDVIWLQCNPCAACYHQHDPIYDPSASSTYKPLTCNSRECNSLAVSACRIDSCLYQVSYGDGSYTVGNFATETVSFGSSGSVSNVALGCGHVNEGLFAGAAGLLGVGLGPLSLPSQIRATSFSYCLVNRDSSSSSTLEFNSAQPPDSVLAPLLNNSFTDTYYYVGLTGISVGGRPVKIPAYLFEIDRDGRGGVIVDSGTAVTRFPTEIYYLLQNAFASMTRDMPAAAGFSLLDTCYDLSSMVRVSVPTVSFQFSGGNTLLLPPTNYLIPVDNEGKFCFAFAKIPGSMSIIGNVQQQHTRVSYNLADKYIAFSPNKC
ncbi:hypothetical protein OROGR_008484 [Orobanche gracilis]